MLKEVGALTLKCGPDPEHKVNNPHDGDLTYVGSIMASLPIDVHLSKLILLGHTFGKLRETIIIAAALSTKTFFTCYFKSYLESFRAKWTWSEGWNCDCISILNAYNTWEKMTERDTFANSRNMYQWCKTHMIQLERIKEVRELKTELEERLKRFHIKCNRHVTINNRGARNITKSDLRSYNIDNQENREQENLILKVIRIIHIVFMLYKIKSNNLK